MRTITSSKEIDGLFGRADRAANTYVMILAAPTPVGRGPEGRVVFIAGKKLGNAVMRNRAKRVLRSAASELGAPWQGWDVALLARPATGDAPHARLLEAIESALNRLGVELP